MTVEAERIRDFADIGFEDGGRDHKPRNSGGFQMQEKTNRFSFRASRRNAALLTPGVGFRKTHFGLLISKTVR